MLTLPRFTAAAIQNSPVFLDATATVAKAVDLIAEAAGNGASLIAFPEVFVPGYPYWNWTMNPVAGSPWFEQLYRAAIDVPGPACRPLRAAAAGTGHHRDRGERARPQQPRRLYNSDPHHRTRTDRAARRAPQTGADLGREAHLDERRRQHGPGARHPGRARSALSGIFGPDGRPVVEPLVDQEGIVYGEIDLARCIQPKQMHDIIGHYNRFDVFRLYHTTAPLSPLVTTQGPLSAELENEGANGAVLGPWQA